MYMQGKELVCTQDLTDAWLGESKNTHLESRKSGSVQAICLDVITLIQQFVDNNVETCVGAKLQLHS